MPKIPKWVKCPNCFNGHIGMTRTEIRKHKGIIDGCFGPHWWECYPRCSNCNGQGRIDLRAKKEAKENK